MKINGHKYGEFISKDDMCKEIRISKRKASYLLQNGYIPCEIRESQTWRYKIRTKDVAEYIKKGVEPKLPAGLFKAPPKIDTKKVKLDKNILAELFTEMMEKYPDALSLDDVGKITGYMRWGVPEWISSGELKSVKMNHRRTIVPKEWLLEFMLSDEFLDRYTNNPRFRKIISQAVIEK